MRQIVLDTETTGLEPERGHRIIEIGAVEITGRRLTGKHFHTYVNPERAIDEGALAVHGLTREFLMDKPGFAEVAPALVDFVRGAELIIHNAPFDVAFIDQEFARLEPSPGKLDSLCEITDSLALARLRHPGQKNSLNALCRRYGVDNSGRDLHGALLDAELLADVFLAMTGGQAALRLEEEEDESEEDMLMPIPSLEDRPPLRVIRATPEEEAAHLAWLHAQDKHHDGGTLWRRLGLDPAPAQAQPGSAEARPEQTDQGKSG